MQVQKLEFITKKEQSQISAHRVAQESIQRTLQLLRLKEILLLISFSIGGALLRIPMQKVPSAEPITFFAILAGWLFGRYKGAAVGASSLYISNFFMFGGQGPWSVFQAAGFAAAGFLGGMLRGKARWWECAVVFAGATLIFEVLMNAFTIIGGGGIFLTFFIALPFLGIHLVSNLIFSAFLPKFRKFILEKGKFDEKKICMDALASLRSRAGAKLSGIFARK